MSARTVILPAEGRDERVANLCAFLKAAMPGKRVLVEVSAYSPRRSGNLNNYYWGVVVKRISEATGYEPEEVHEICAMKFLPPRVVEIAGETHVLRSSTAKLPTVEFQGYVEAVKRWAAQELSLYIPEPNEYEQEAA